MMIVEEIIREVPQLSEGFESVESLSGGLCNQTYKVQTKHRSYVLRVNSNQNEYLGLTRSSEVEAMRLANLNGFAPSVIAADRPEQFHVTEFVEGRMVSHEDLERVPMVDMIIDRLKQIHRMEGISRKLTPYQLIHGYLSGADQFQIKPPDELSGILRRVEEITYKRSNDKAFNNKFCHNDSFTCNMIYTGKQLQIIDWELSGYGDVFFELAIIPFSNRFTEAQEKDWLRRYFGYYEEEQFIILQDMKWMCMVREIAWGMFYSGLNKETALHGFDYYKHAEYAIDRLNRGIYFL